MDKPWRLGVAVLAAGASRRFGEADKLLADFQGKPLGEHVVQSIPLNRAIRAGAWVIASQMDHPCQAAWSEAGFGVVVNENASNGLGSSVAAAARIACQAKLDSMLIALADMPLVPHEHFAALIDRAATTRALVASYNGEQRMPPAIFGKNRLAQLSDLSGQFGARAMLEQAEIVECPPEWLIDIDTPDDLARHGH